MKPPNLTDRDLFVLLDREMLRGYLELLHEMDEPITSGRFHLWDNDARAVWLEWCEGIEGMSELDRLKLLLWKELAHGFTGFSANCSIAGAG